MNNDYVPANRNTLIVTILCLVFYIGVRLNVGLLVNYIISYNVELINVDIVLAERQEEAKLVLQTILIAVPSIVFFIFVGWVSFLIIRTKTIPPKPISFPFGMKRLSGKEALFIGYVGVAASTVQVFSSIYSVYDNYILVSS